MTIDTNICVWTGWVFLAIAKGSLIGIFVFSPIMAIVGSICDVARGFGIYNTKVLYIPIPKHTHAVSGKTLKISTLTWFTP